MDDVDLKLARLRLELKNAIATRKDGVQPAELEAIEAELRAVEAMIEGLATRLAELEQRPATVERIVERGGVVVQPGFSYMPSGW